MQLQDEIRNCHIVNIIVSNILDKLALDKLALAEITDTDSLLTSLIPPSFDLFIGLG